ncbi:cytochrome c biogenesis protein CcdA [Treponema brennaborense]|uniref:Cytochrome c biogenesis protein transmembrane region n=1 Tax=Treponema brennaborense (strain DSM 12168 / CIP 105900 / DD5/3) TaxID=906968 RepID=F4LPJ9_TREBD|nr:cytochrome c biogenesis protein CcdA [Treponema brennaborense]AEE16010.1 cytochrome c biogenesis protein transmembrane region [Treponema brennaborense DSM 12168]
MGLTVDTGIPAFTVFIQGLLSFFSPCVLPLIPLYVSYLAGGALTKNDDGTVAYPRGRILVNTVFFILGISFAFFALGFGFTSLGRFFSAHKIWFARVSGIIMILFGLYQVGLFGRSNVLDRERRLPFKLNGKTVNPALALLLGFTFSFAWTPCIGPVLSSVLLMASSAKSAGWGFTLIGVYTLGFVLPFLAAGIFTGAVLNFFKKYRKAVSYTVKVGGALLIVMGVLTLTGFMNGVTGYLSSAGARTAQTQPQDVSARKAADSQSVPVRANAESAAEKNQAVPAPDFSLTDQFGTVHRLSDYKGKTVFLNFWATWCPPCQGEMPDIQKLYEKYGKNTGDLIVLGVANPKSEGYPYAQDKSVSEVARFLSDRNLTFPVVMDLDGSVFSGYGITAFPTTFMIDDGGNVFGYVPGALTGAIMESIVQQTITKNRL